MMKKALIFCALFALGVVGAVCWFHFPKVQAESSYPPSFGASFLRHQPLVLQEEKPFVVVIPSYKNATFCIRNLDSVFDQKYSNYRVIYIDDCSPDNTYELVKEHVQRRGQQERVILIKNVERAGAMLNLYRAIHSCRKEEIVVTLDGDDYLAHEYVLQRLNLAYADPHIWLTYGQYLDYPSFSLGCNRPIDLDEVKKVGFRKATWRTSHLRTFYAWLFQKIRVEDFFYEGKFLEMGWDLSMMMPMMEMAWEGHYRFIPDILYLYNNLNPLSDSKVNLALQEASANHIRTLPPYAPLLNAPVSLSNLDTDICIFSYDRPMQVYACLESMHTLMKDMHQIFVLYRASNEQFALGYDKVKEAFPHVQFIRQSQNPHEDFKPLVLDVVYGKRSTPAAYIAFCVDDLLVKDHVSLKECAHALEHTGAYGFYLRLGEGVDYCYSVNFPQGIPLLTKMDDKVLAWQFSKGKGDWDYPNTVDMTVYSKAEIKEALHKYPYKHPNSFEGIWAEHADHGKVGLCFKEAKVVNIPDNLVNIAHVRHMNAHTVQELLDRFLQGQKIDISTVYQIKNRSAHIEHALQFISR